ncbi:MAG: NfeD family protein [Halothece sp.]
MLIIYIACSLIGGLFVLLSVSGGLDGFDLDADADADFDADSEVDDVDFGTHQGKTEKQPNPWLAKSSSKKKLWLPFFSFKFWTFGICFFGVTGLALTWLQPNLGDRVIALIAALMGLLIGTAMAWLLRALGGNYTNSMASTDDLVGVIGTVEIPFDQNSRGKVQLPIKGSTVGFSAMTEQETEFQPGEQVLVVSYQDNKLWVVSADTLQDNE